MFAISPRLILCFASLCRTGLVSLKAGQRWHRVGQEAAARGLQRPAELLGDLDGRAAQHLGVELVRARLDLLLDRVEERDQRVAVDREAVALGLLAERVVGARLPVDQGAVDVECDERDVLGKRHRPRIMPRKGGCRRAATARRVSCRAAMDLLEYQGKQLFARHGVPVPTGTPATTVEEAVAAADEIGYPCVVKAQVLIGGRGKAGGIKLAKDRAEARQHATDDPRHGHQGPHGPRGVDRGRVGHRRGVLRVDRLRPRREGSRW